ncbi:MAG TPA: ABC transporter, partial [Corynebacterium variabile]|nr:ABC transporter [Corynebacterium variabile]
TGDILADSALVDSADSADSASVVLGTERGYVSDPTSGTVTELDVADGLRETREFDLGGAPGALAVTGGK